MNTETKNKHYSKARESCHLLIILIIKVIIRTIINNNKETVFLTMFARLNLHEKSEIRQFRKEWFETAPALNVSSDKKMLLTSK